MGHEGADFCRQGWRLPSPFSRQSTSNFVVGVKYFGDQEYNGRSPHLVLGLLLFLLEAFVVEIDVNFNLF